MKGLPRSLAHARQSGENELPVHSLVIEFSGSFTVANGSSAPGIGDIEIAALPSGKFHFLSASISDMVFTTADADAIATWDGDWSVGSVANADADLTDATDFDIVGISGGQAIGAATAKVSPTQNVMSVKNVAIDNSADDKVAILNVMVDDASQSGAITMSVSGKFTLAYIPFPS